MPGLGWFRAMPAAALLFRRRLCDHCGMPPIRHIAALVLVAALLAAGCGRDDPGADAQAVQSVLRRGNGGDPGSLDPALAQDEHAFNVLADLYEGLVIYGPDGALLPGVAERWTVSDDGLVYRFELRPDARWSNGEAVTAGHFVHALERAQAAETAAPLSFLLNPVDTVLAEDNATLVIRLEAPASHFLAVLAMAIALPVWPELEPDAFNDPARLVSNGAYLLESWRPGELLRLRRNPQFHDATDAAPEAVEYYPISDPAAELTRYRAGELDLTATVPPASLDALLRDRPGELVIAPRLAVYYLALDMGEAPLDEAGLRQALSMAIDRETLTRIIGRGEQPAYGFVPDGIAGYTPARHAWAALAAEERLAEARRLFAAGGHDESLSLTLMYDTGDIHEQVALAVAAMWKDAFGIGTRLDKREWKYFLDSRALRGDWDAMRFAWTGDFAHPATFLDLFMSNNPMNLPGYDNPQYDRYLETGDFSRAEALLLEEHPVIPLYFYVSKHLVSPAVHGFHSNPLDLHPSRFVSLR